MDYQEEYARRWKALCIAEGHYPVMPRVLPPMGGPQLHEDVRNELKSRAIALRAEGMRVDEIASKIRMSEFFVRTVLKEGGKPALKSRGQASVNWVVNYLRKSGPATVQEISEAARDAGVNKCVSERSIRRWAEEPVSRLAKLGRVRKTNDTRPIGKTRAAVWEARS